VPASDGAPAPVKPTPTPAAERTFTQAELDAHIAERLGREKAKFSDYDKLKADAKRLADIDAANLTAQEKADKRVKDAEAERDAEKAKNQTTVIKYAVKDAARDAGALYPDAVYRLLDIAAVEYDDKGNPTNIDKLVKALKATYPAMFAQPTTPGGPGPLPPAGSLPLGAITHEDRLKQSVPTRI
jgi:rhamnose utilization protein RhaD (predicted bifunctional aldolase and dehydrogenase)